MRRIGAGSMDAARRSRDFRLLNGRVMRQLVDALRLISSSCIAAISPAAAAATTAAACSASPGLDLSQYRSLADHEKKFS